MLIFCLVFAGTYQVASVFFCSFKGVGRVVAQMFCFNVELLFNNLIERLQVYIRKAPGKGLKDLLRLLCFYCRHSVENPQHV